MSIAIAKQQGQQPSITVIIPTLNAEKFILNTLAQLAEQDYPADLLEILVVDGGSTDNTLAQVNRVIPTARIPITLLHNPKNFTSAARNIGIQRARGDYLLFIDAHVFIPSRHLIRAMANTAIEKGAQILARPRPLITPCAGKIAAAIAGLGTSPMGRSCEPRLDSHFEGWVSPLSVGVMYCRSLFERYGLFDENFDAAEDVEFNYRLEQQGLQAFISPRFAVHHYSKNNLTGLFHQMTRYGHGRINFLRKHPERSHPEILLPCLISLGAFSWPVLYAWLEPYRLLLSLTLLTALLMGVFLLRSPAVSSRLSTQLLMPVCWLLICLGLAYGILRGLLARNGKASAQPASRRIEPSTIYVATRS